MNKYLNCIETRNKPMNRNYKLQLDKKRICAIETLIYGINKQINKYLLVYFLKDENVNKQSTSVE